MINVINVITNNTIKVASSLLKNIAFFPPLTDKALYIPVLYSVTQESAITINA